MQVYKAIRVIIVIEIENFCATDLGFITNIDRQLIKRYGMRRATWKAEDICDNAPTTKDQGGD